MAINSARRIFCSHGSFFAIFRFLNGLYIPYPAFSRLHCPLFICFGGLNDTSV